MLLNCTIFGDALAHGWSPDQQGIYPAILSATNLQLNMQMLRDLRLTFGFIKNQDNCRQYTCNHKAIVFLHG